jgi:hypothetical protein
VDSLLRGATEVQVGSSSMAGSHSELQCNDHHVGYDFHDPAVVRSVLPPAAPATRPLRWWSLDRGKRRAAALRHRDNLIEDILRIGCTRKVPTQAIRRR